MIVLVMFGRESANPDFSVESLAQTVSINSTTVVVISETDCDLRQVPITSSYFTKRDEGPTQHTSSVAHRSQPGRNRRETRHDPIVVISTKETHS